MKKLFVLAVCVVGFSFIAAPIYVKTETRQLVAAGRRFGTAQFVNGQWALSLKEFSKLAGVITLEPSFQLQGNHRLVAVSSGGDRTAKKAIQASAAPNTIGGVIGNVAGGAQEKPLQGGVFHVRKAGEISHNVFLYNGEYWVPLADVATAFGGTFTAPAGNLQPGQSMSLNFTLNGDGILALNQ
jgi:hypothetical protein